jgi:hypothetical protein
MSDEQQFLITVRFPAWTQEADGQIHKFSAFGVKYLLITGVIPYPDWPEDDERWFTHDESKEVAKRFVSWYKANIKDEFNGEILFIEPADFTIANTKEQL